MFNRTNLTKKKLIDICEIKKGKQLNKEHMLPNGKYFVLNGGVEPSGKTSDWNVAENTISISEGGNSCGYVSYNREKFWSGGHNYTLGKLKVNNEYLYHCLKAKENHLKALRVGSGLPNIQLSSLRDFEVILYNEKEQQKIGLFFGEIDNLIYKISKKKENIQKLFNHILNRSFSKSKNLKKLEELLIYKSEKNKNSYNEVYSVSNKRGFIKQTDYFSEHTVASSDLKNYKVVKKYDFAYNPARINVGSIAVYEQNEPGVVSPMYVVFGTNNINYKYLNYFFKSKYFKVQLSQYLVGSVRKILDFKSMSKIIINFDKDNQKKVEDILDKLEKLIELETKRFEYLSIFKEHYLRLIFN